MMIPSLYLVLALIFVIFGGLLVPVWLFMRQVAMRGDIADAIHKVELMNRDYTAILAESTALNTKIADVSGQLAAAEVRAISTDETIRSLANKMNSRERVERQRQKQDERKEETTSDDLIHQHGLPLFEPETAEPSQPLKRKFGARS